MPSKKPDLMFVLAVVAATGVLVTTAIQANTQRSDVTVSQSVATAQLAEK